MRAKYWLDGIPCTRGAASIDPSSPLAAWGEGFFETVRVHHGEVLAKPEHMERMARSLQQIYPHAWNPHLFNRVWAVAAKDSEELNAGRLRITAYPSDSEATELRFIGELRHWRPMTEQEYQRGLDLTYSKLEHPRIGSRGKSASYHWARMGVYEARRYGVDEVLFVHDDRMIETTSSSVLLLNGGQWFTPDSASGGLHSTTVAAMERAGLEVEKREVETTEIPNAKAVVVVNAMKIAIGVRRIADQVFTEPDKHAKQLRELLLSPS